MLSSISFWNPYYTHARQIHAILFVSKHFLYIPLCWLLIYCLSAINLLSLVLLASRKKIDLGSLNIFS